MVCGVILTNAVMVGAVRLVVLTMWFGLVRLGWAGCRCDLPDLRLGLALLGLSMSKTVGYTAVF